MSFTNPIPSGTVGRTDQGVDISASPGAAAYDPVPGISRLRNILPNWYRGQSLFNFDVLTGPFKGKNWYVAEQFKSGVAIGQKVRQGQQIGTYAPSGTATEWGWSTPTGETLSVAHGTENLHPNHSNTPEGIDFASRLRGAKKGRNVPGQTVTGWRVKASQESDGGQGACGPIGTGGLWYSELSTVPRGNSSDFHALGNLPCGTALTITNPANGKSVVARKRDVGAGSAFLPVMGLYPATSAALGLSGGVYTVVISRVDNGDLHPVRGTKTTVATGTSGASTGLNRGGGAPAPSGVDTLFKNYTDLRDTGRTDPSAAPSLASSFGWWMTQFQASANKVFGGR